MTMNVQYIPHPETHEEWLKIRTQSIGSSDAAAVVNCSEYKSAYEVWLEKTGQTEIETEAPSYAARMGNQMEPIIADEYVWRRNKEKEGIRKDKSLRVVKDNKIRFHGEHKFLSCNLDRIIYNDTRGSIGILECKTANMFAAKEWEEGIPGAYYVQVQHQLMVTGFQYADVCLLQHGIYDLKIIPIERNDEFIERLLEAEVLFWEKFVTKRAEPPLLSRELQLKESNGNSIEADADICKVLEVYREQRKCLEALEGDIKQSEEKIKQYIGENDILTVGGKKAASWKSYSNRRFSNKLFKEEHPDMYEQYRIASPTRKFLLTKPKKSK